MKTTVFLSLKAIVDFTLLHIIYILHLVLDVGLLQNCLSLLNLITHMTLISKCNKLIILRQNT